MTANEQDYGSRINKALDLAIRFGQIDGSHHRLWVIDRIVRALCGSVDGEETEEYKLLIADACEEDGDPEAYEWDTGIAP